MIRLEQVSVERGGRAVLAEIDLQIAERRVGLIGANGSGKSTLLRLLNGLQRPSAGHVVVDGLDSVADLAKLRRRVGFVFQNPDNQIVLPSVGEDLAFGLRPLRLAKAEAAARVAAALADFGLEGFENRPIHTLSGGEKQLVALLGVTIMAPELILFDEPTTLLDLRNTKRFMAKARAASQRMVLATHDLTLLADFDRVIALEQGRVLADGAPADVIAAYERSCL